jgi:hypothetical protein
MQMISIAATPAAFLLPSRSSHVNAGKLAFLNMLVVVFFLFTAGYHFPGGASHYPDWAESIMHGAALPPSVAQREVGFPLLYILGGFSVFHSFIGITLILAAFGVLIPVLVYFSLVRTSPTIAYYMGLSCIASLSSVTYMKFLYPDQADMFFNLLAITLLIGFLWTGRFRMLYLFTFAALAASLIRTAGNLMYPVLLAISYVTVRGRFGHYLGCVLIFALGLGLNAWHRYEIFDMRNQSSHPSGMGMQILYSEYLYLGDFGYRLSPDIGPNTKRLIELMRQELQPSVRESPLIKKQSGDSPPEFMEKYFYAYTPDELIEKICTEPNEEYYWNVIQAIDTNDQFYLSIAGEIARAYPLYIVEYSIRNLWHTLFDPGYATPRYSTIGFSKTGNDFVPATQGWGVHSEDPVTQFGSRAAREMEYFPLKDKPYFIRRIFTIIEFVWVKYFGLYVFVTSVLITIAWIGAVLGMLCLVFPRKKFCQAPTRAGFPKLAAPVIAASGLLVYQDLATAMFSQPVYRYFHMTEPLRLVIVGFGVAVVTGALSSEWRANFAAEGPAPIQPTRANAVAELEMRNLSGGYFGQQRTQLYLLLAAMTAILSAWWTSSILAIVGVGAAFVMGAKSASPTQGKFEGIVSAIQKHDLIDGYFGQRRSQWVFLLLIANATLFAWWASRMIAHTWIAPSL